MSSSAPLQFGVDSGWQSCCQGVILLGDKVASDPWETRENNQVLKAEIHSSHEWVLDRSPVPLSQCLALLP